MKRQITENGRIIAFELLQTKRKTYAIEIKPPGQVIVKAPLHATEEKIIEMVRSKSKWIWNKIDLFDKNKHVLAEQQVKGPTKIYQGKVCPIEVKMIGPKEQQKVLYLDGIFQAYTRKNDALVIDDLLLHFFVTKAQEKMTERIQFFQQQMGVAPLQMTLKNQKRRWGSCSSKGVIHLNWKLIMAPQEVMDYVIVHELAHLIELNHSKAFWKVVKKYMPRYLEYRKWLKINGFLLEWH